MKLDDLSLRRRTNLAVFSDDVLVQHTVGYIRYLRKHNFHQTILMHVTAVFFDDIRDTTVDATGERHDVVRSTDFASMRVTMLTTTASGRKHSPLVIWKHKLGDRTILMSSLCA